jgi:hypothetical protein
VLGETGRQSVSFSSIHQSHRTGQIFVLLTVHSWVQ